MKNRLLFITILILTITFQSKGQSFDVLIDINTGSANSNITFPVAFKNLLYFSATNGSSTGQYGQELWKSDGTIAGTTLVKDINNGTLSSAPTDLTLLNSSTLIFIADDGSHGTELFVSDGTSVGTKLLKDINPSGSSNPGSLTVSNGILYFAANDGNGIPQLWKSDGTASGTLKITSVNQTSFNPGIYAVSNGIIYFKIYDINDEFQIWKSDGTVGNESLLVNQEPFGFVYSNGTLFFVGEDGELWKTNGTTAGTVLVKDIFPGSNPSSPSYMTSFNGELYFTATNGITSSKNGRELWKSDGTEAGTVLVKDIIPGLQESDPINYKLVGDKLFFSAKTNSSGRELFVSDGTEAGTVLVKDIKPGGQDSSPFKLTDVGGVCYFSTNLTTNPVYISNGTSVGTKSIPATFTGAFNSVVSITNVNNSVFVVATTDKGQELVFSENCIPNTPVNTTASTNLTVCHNSTTQLNVTGSAGGKIGWYSAATGGVYLGQGANFTTKPITETTTFYVQDSLCGPSSRIALTVSTLPEIIVTTTSQSNLLCYGNSNGSATISASGGVGPLTYLWAPDGETIPSISGKVAGTYNCTIKGANNCQKLYPVVITQPAILDASISKVDIICYGDLTGTATLTISGGTAPYTYLWDNGGETTKNISNKPAGIYTCTIKDANNCEKTQQVIISEPTVVVPSISSQTNPTCFGDANGSATVTATGGTPGYTYSWSPGGETSASISGKVDGTYTCTIKDSKQCTKTQQVVLVQPPYINRGITLSLGGTKFTVDEVDATYQWFNCDNNQQIPGANQRSYVSTTSSGRFKVRITKNGCTVESACVDMNSAGIDDLQVNVMEVYPNPSTGEFTIEIPFNATVTITNMLGQEVYSNSVTNGTTLINLTGLTKGVYNIKATTEEGENYLERVVID